MANPYSWGSTAGIDPMIGYGLDKPIVNVPVPGSAQSGGMDWGKTLMGAGALFEGIGQLARGIRGEPPAPMGMATRALSDYLNQGRQDSMLARLIEQLTEDNTGVELNLKPGSKDITRVTGGAS